MFVWIFRAVYVLKSFTYVSVVCLMTPLMIGSAGVYTFFSEYIWHEHVVSPIFHLEVNNNRMVSELSRYDVMYLNEGGYRKSMLYLFECAFWYSTQWGP